MAVTLTSVPQIAMRAALFGALPVGFFLMAFDFFSHKVEDLSDELLELHLCGRNHTADQIAIFFEDALTGGVAGLTGCLVKNLTKILVEMSQRNTHAVFA